MLETNPDLAECLPTWQRSIDTTRLAAEFSAFAEIEVLAGDGPTHIGPEQIILGQAAFARPALLGFWLRMALEQAWLLRAEVAPDAAALAAARTAALFAAGEHDLLTQTDLAALPGWVNVMASEIAPAAAMLAALWPQAGAQSIARIRACWSLLGTAEALMETGGDIRLARDPLSALNGYGSSHRPRPWAITFASSTASSSSARGYVAADETRLRSTALLLTEDRHSPVQAVLDEVRHFLAATYGLAPGGAVVLAASGTDTELLALALSHLVPPAAPILNILIAPEETGSGVPMAARGLHFAADTALGHDVAREAPIEGFRADTKLATIALRQADGAVRDAANVEAEIEAAVKAGVEAGKRVILHVLDLSKTGLLAPGLGCLTVLRAAYGARLDIVVDACQVRLSPASVRHYLALDAVVLLTGSKFFTGPPFAGALLLPPAIAARLQTQALPAGLDAYFGRGEFPAFCPAASALPPSGNYGLGLRWHAAMAEMRAVLAVPPASRAKILRGFAAVVADEVNANPALALLPAPAIQRGKNPEDWELCPSIFTFSMAHPHEPGRCLTPAEARAVYLWLNADLSTVLPALNEDEKILAARICHIGQPVKLQRPDGCFIGVLRVSAGARLISGEPSHSDLPGDARLQREFSDLRTVFKKIALILNNFSLLWAADPAPRYR
jgi:hypothetical protein